MASTTIPSYVNHTLVRGEVFTYRAHRHWITFVGALLFAVGLLGLAGIAASAGAPRELTWGLGIGVALLMLGFGIIRRSAEFVVTNKRLIVKDGLIRRHALELLLAKVEGFEIRQGIWGRLLGYGDLIVLGASGRTVRFTTIAEPLKLHMHILQLV